MNALFGRTTQIFIATLLLALGGCKEAEQAVALTPVAFHASDECHVCGMVIADFPGPKGQAVEKAGVRKFCSTAEMLGWWLQPENQLLDAKLYVHDMARSTWEQPDDNHLIDATQAFYVTGIPLKGAMGTVLATFANEQDAQKLAQKHGGKVLRLAQIDQALLQQATYSQPDASADPHGHAGH